jgi:hypothetical protein
MQELRHREFGDRSSAILAKMLADITGYSVFPEHIRGLEKGERFLSDPLVEALGRIFQISPLTFPEYASRHIHPERIATLPLAKRVELSSRPARPVKPLRGAA